VKANVSLTVRSNLSTSSPSRIRGTQPSGALARIIGGPQSDQATRGGKSILIQELMAGLFKAGSPNSESRTVRTGLIPWVTGAIKESF
jgi:hypothetical protein